MNESAEDWEGRKGKNSNARNTHVYLKTDFVRCH